MHEDLTEPLIGRSSTIVPGHFGDPLTVEIARTSREPAKPSRPLFLCLHGWGSNEDDLADMMHYVAPYNDYVALRAPLVLQEPSNTGWFAQPGAYSWFHDAVPTGEDLDYDAFAAATAIDTWVQEHIEPNRDIVPIGFSQGGLLAVHLLRIHPQRYRASICLSGFIAPGIVPGTHPADDILTNLEIPVFYGYGTADPVIPQYEVHATEAWLEEHTWLTVKHYNGMDHAVCMDEFADIRQWLLERNISSGML